MGIASLMQAGWIFVCASPRDASLRFCILYHFMGVRVRLLQRAHILANEPAARAGRGQAIAPTMDELRRVIHRSMVGAMACPRPGALQQSHAHPFYRVSILYTVMEKRSPMIN